MRTEISLASIDQSQMCSRHSKKLSECMMSGMPRTKTNKKELENNLMI